MKSSTFIEEVPSPISLEALGAYLSAKPGVLMLQSGTGDAPLARYSYVVVNPFLVFKSWGARCETYTRACSQTQFGNPWHLLDALLNRYELLEEIDLPFPLGGCFGFWGYDLKRFLEPRLGCRAVRDLEIPDCYLGFHSSLLAADHHLGKAWIVSTGLQPDGSRSPAHAIRERDEWLRLLDQAHATANASQPSDETPQSEARPVRATPRLVTPDAWHSNLAPHEFLRLVQRAQEYIRAGDIYQVNLAQRLTAPLPASAWDFHSRLALLSPAPYAAWLNAGDFQMASSSPELFLRMSGSQIRTRPIKGTRPRSSDPTRDAQWTYELQTSAKDMAELIMITDLLRNDLGRVCDFGSVQVPELVRLERYAHVQHLVSTIEGRLRPGCTHLQALATCFPGGSITGAPKIRAMEIIDELEPITRGSYTGCLGYLGFNRESQLSILIRTGICHDGCCHFHVGAGIVADSDPQAELAETLSKAGGFFNVLRSPQSSLVPAASACVHPGDSAHITHASR